MDHYIEVVWNGVRTRVPVMGYIASYTEAVVVPAMIAFAQSGPTVHWTFPDADSEYDRDVLGEWPFRGNDDGSGE